MTDNYFQINADEVDEDRHRLVLGQNIYDIESIGFKHGKYIFACGNVVVIRKAKEKVIVVLIGGGPDGGLEMEQSTNSYWSRESHATGVRSNAA